MKILERLLHVIAGFREDLEGGMLARRSVEAHEAEICGMNTQGQLYEQGVNALGVSIMDYRPYTPFTVSVKRMKGQPADRVTLRDTGAFHRRFYVAVTNTEFTLYSTDDKTGGLVKKYGKEIFGLTDENRMELAVEYVAPDVTAELRSRLATIR